MVEWKKLGEICTNLDFKRKPITSAKRVAGIYPYYGASGIVDYVENYIFDGDYLLVSEDGANLLARTSPIAFSINGKNWVNNHAHVLEFKYTTTQKFVEVYLNMIDLSPWINGAAQPKLNQANLSIIDIPFPPLSEQNRIVGILDTFTDSIENLKQQIAQRRKQYEFYRDQLLDLEGKEGVEMISIKSLFDTRNGYTPSTKNIEFWDEGIIPWFKMEDIRDNGKILNDSNLHITPKAIKGKGLFKANSIILATSATIGEHALITVEHLSNQRFTNLFPKDKYIDNVNMKFVYYYMFKIDEWCKQHTHQGGFASVDMDGFYKLDFPVPSIEEQNRIVSILDTFEASISNLEAQLAQRQKQYEYYRNKLLSFGNGDGES